ncbi:hypothetical protein [Streptomyces sp. NPDC048659]|uniref:hypothetical protein n=1 Tax=Streptomyces sp. NPDC048659 TaxID=3155489 RepID=UPI00343A96E3
MVPVSPGADGDPKVSLDYQVDAGDRYNGDHAKETMFPGGIVIRDDERGRSHEMGIAREFDMRGSGSTFHHGTRKTTRRLLTVLAASLLLSSCSTADRDRASRDPYPYWEKGAGARQAADFMKVGVPAGAAEVKGAVQVNPREDVYLLSFVTDAATAVRVAEGLRSEKPIHTKAVDVPPSRELFGHLGLPEPQTLKGARWAGVCPPCVRDSRRGSVQWIDVYVYDLAGGKARVYLHAF